MLTQNIENKQDIRHQYVDKTFAPTTNMSNKTFSRFNKFPIPPANPVVLEQKTQSCDVLETLGMCRLIVVFDS